jgi:hypothetical protein
MRWASVFVPLAATFLVHGMPWWAYLLVGVPGISICTVAYIYRLRGVYRLAAKALEKAEHSEVAAIMTTVTGLTAMADTNTSCQRRRNSPQSPSLASNIDPGTDTSDPDDSSTFPISEND